MNAKTRRHKRTPFRANAWSPVDHNRTVAMRKERRRREMSIRILNQAMRRLGSASRRSASAVTSFAEAFVPVQTAYENYGFASRTAGRDALLNAGSNF